MRTRTWLPIVIAIVTVLFSNNAYRNNHTPTRTVPVHSSTQQTSSETPKADTSTDHSVASTVTYIKTNHALPDFYLTKSQAVARGWIPSHGNLTEVAPGMMIGGDVFTNSEHLLPSAPGRVWYEADFDYTGGSRNADRILYSNDGLVYITTDHYKTVTQQ